MIPWDYSGILLSTGINLDMREQFMIAKKLFLTIKKLADLIVYYSAGRKGIPMPPPLHLFPQSSNHWRMLPTGRTFMEQTRYEYLTESDQRQGRPAPPLEKK